MSQPTVYSLMTLRQQQPHPDSREDKNRASYENCSRLTKFRGREVRNILMDLDQSFNSTPKGENPPPVLMHPHPFYSPSCRYTTSSASSRSSSSQRSLIQRYSKRRRGCEWSCCCKVTAALVILVLLAWGTAVPLYFLSEYRPHFPVVFFALGGPGSLTPGLLPHSQSCPQNMPEGGGLDSWGTKSQSPPRSRDAPVVALKFHDS